MENSQSQTQKSKLSRRDFLKIGAATVVAGAGVSVVQSAKKPVVTQSGSLEEAIIKTTCALCPSGCGLDVRVVNGKAVKVEGNPLHPLNQGVCCLKGQTALEVLYSPERIKHPRIQTGARGSGDWKEISWDEALDLVVDKLAELREDGKSHSVALMHGELRGQMRQVVNRFMRAYGSPNVISRESLGEGTARLAMWLSQGVNTIPVYDINNANYVLTFGGNLLESSRNLIGYLSATAFMRRGRPQRGKLVAVHPRLSLTGIKADEWVPIRPGTYGALALGMASVIINSKLYDEDFVRDFTYGFEDFEDAESNSHQGFKSLVLESYTLDRVSAITGVPTDVIARVAGEFATNRPAVAVLPTEPGELSSGNALHTALAVHALNALVGSIDAQGGVILQRFPELTEWPAYALDSDARKGEKQERLDGAGTQFPLAISAYQNVPERILKGKPYPIEALFLLNDNPVYDVPNGGQSVEALMKVPFVVSFASTLDESAAHADLILPASTFMEVWGDDYLEGTGYPGISLRRPVVEPVHDTRAPGDVLLDLAQRLGGSVGKAFPWNSYKELIEDRLSTLDWEKLEANGNWSELVYFNAEPGSPAWNDVVGRDRLNAPKDGRFDFFSRELFATLAPDSDLSCLPHFEIPTTLTDSTADSIEYPFLLVTQPLITQSQQWQGIVPTLQESYGLQGNVKWDSWVEVSQKAAEALHLEDGERVWVESPINRVQATVRVYAGIWPNAVYLPPGQGHHTFVRWGRKSKENSIVGANPNMLTKFDSEPLTGLAVAGPARVRIYPV
ncbi:MAG: molybdopterin-dependent oxidoreductase [Anaerolineales bacterium]|uniref:Molybdopterin-dependent oxidoreductase n=1 Tax=Candidatus Desulfolinea nitratireducens TaxID=2841698 RepID=A0A8J6TJP4_9CHLR|nr:molybdopterin-dependent oxidoreductase [Candidatus Desulfolinea nitratireducens]MBL6959676.1 molybdopterin-dependent oxidoreductase [Anaerolineales bacterium]